MERGVTPSKPVTSPTWGPPPPCKQALRDGLSSCINNIINKALEVFILFNLFILCKNRFERLIYQTVAKRAIRLDSRQAILFAHLHKKHTRRMLSEAL